MTVSQEKKFKQFKALHEVPETFVMPNAWNAGTARMLTSLGFESLATTSAGFAYSIGRKDQVAGLTRDEILENAREILEATPLPVSADLEDGFGAAPEACAETIRQACAIGLAGGSVEDATGDKSMPIYDFGHAVERVAAACEAARDLPFVLTARAENFICGNPDLDDTIRRLQAFEEAGADVLYAPGLKDLEMIRTVCSSLSKPVNVVMGLVGPAISVADLQDAGVKRISVGGSFARAAFGALMRAATEVREHGTFGYAADAMPDAEAMDHMVQTSRDRG